MFRVGILTVSDRCHSGLVEDISGSEVAARLSSEFYEVRRRVVCPDDEGVIADELLAMCDNGCDLILTTGGVGFAPRDVTPEATVSILDRNAPGIAELLRADARQKTTYSALNRGIAGIHERTLIINLPDTLGELRDALTALAPILPHALVLLHGERVKRA